MIKLKINDAPKEKTQLTIALPLVKILLAIMFFLVVANLLGIFSKYVLHHGTVFGLVRLFDMNAEKNVPTLFSSLILIISAGLLWVIALIAKQKNFSSLPWIGLAVIFLFLALDEFSSIHEMFTYSFRNSMKTEGFLYYAWVIPYGIALLAFLAIYAKFLIFLPKRFALLFIISGSIYVSGALGMEMIDGYWADKMGTDNIEYAFLYTLEETLEMTGIVFFIYSLLSYIETFSFVEIEIYKIRKGEK